MNRSKTLTTMGIVCMTCCLALAIIDEKLPEPKRLAICALAAVSITCGLISIRKKPN